MKKCVECGITALDVDFSGWDGDFCGQCSQALYEEHLCEEAEIEAEKEWFNQQLDN